MEQTFNKEKYAGFINVVQIIVKVIMVILYVVLGVLGLVFLASLVIPRNTLNIDLSEINNYRFQVITVINSIDPTILDRVINVKRILIVGLFAAIVNVGFIQFILHQVRKLLENVKEEPFKNENSKILKLLSYGFFASSIIISTLGNIFGTVVANVVAPNLDIHLGFDINWQFVFIGVLIFILGYVFSYGSYLQEEHDATL